MGNRSRNKNRNKKPANDTKSVAKKNEVQMRKGSSKGQASKGNGTLVTTIMVVIVAVVVGILMRRSSEDDTMDASLRSYLSSFVCHDPDGYCHDALVPVRRTQKAKRYIRPGQVVLVVPRRLQIWDLDALRDPWIQQELSTARHGSTGNPLDSGAHLAAYLARRHSQQQHNDHMRPYLDILPLYEELATFHPVTWTEIQLAELLAGPHSSSFLVAKGYRDMVLSEYKAFVSVSLDFRQTITLEEYMRMRIHVMSRSFGAGPPGEEERIQGKTLQDELELHRKTFGVDLSKGCRSMVPMLDMYNHHARPNVDWRYEADNRAFVIYSSSDGIPSGHDIMDSYGKYTDSHLFAKFGFCNGDGSGHTQASIAVLHRLLNVGMQQQFSYLPFGGSSNDKSSMGRRQVREQMVRYLQFDDGHSECIQEEKHKEAFELKQLKFQVLLEIANIPDRWVLTMPPRDPNSRPLISSDVPITTKPPKFDVHNLKLDASKLISTCRLMVLREDDSDGSARTVLKEILENSTVDSFMVGRQSDALEFRALECLARLSGIALQRFGSTVQEETKLLTRQAHPSPNWTTAHVRLGEMQTLDLLQGISLSGMRQLGKNIPKQNLQLRQKPCPFEYSKPLLKHDPNQVFFQNFER